MGEKREVRNNIVVVVKGGGGIRGLGKEMFCFFN